MSADGQVSDLHCLDVWCVRVGMQDDMTAEQKEVVLLENQWMLLDPEGGR
jgi:hypothetical protein